MASLLHGIAALLAAVLLLGGTGAGAQPEDEEAPAPVIYKWVDENGIAHYTTDRERIPRELRDRFVLPERPRERPAFEAEEVGIAPPPEPESILEPAAPPEPPLRPDPADSADAEATPAPVPDAADADATAASLPDAADADATAALSPDVTPSAPREPAVAPEPAPIPVRASPAPRPSRGRAARSEAWAAMDRREPGEEDLEDELGAELAASDAGRTSAEELDERIRILEAEVQADEEALKALLATPGGDVTLSDDPELKAVAERLPDRLKELQALREERGAYGGPGETESETN